MIASSVGQIFIFGFSVKSLSFWIPVVEAHLGMIPPALDHRAIFVALQAEKPELSAGIERATFYHATMVISYDIHTTRARVLERRRSPQSSRSSAASFPTW
jgi:hypothetical protein